MNRCRGKVCRGLSVCRMRGCPKGLRLFSPPTSALLAGPEEIDDTETEDEGEGEAEPMVESNGTYVFSAWVLQQENPTQSR